MEAAEIRELISAFVPEEILHDFELKEVKKECGVYRLYMETRKTMRAIILGADGSQGGGPMWLYESLRDPDFFHSRLRGIHLHTPAAVEGEGWSKVLFQHL